MNIAEQLVSLLLQAVPTVIIILVFYVFLHYNLFKPLLQVMEERSARIEGARRASESSQAAAQEKERAYLEALKKARADVYAEQDAARRGVLEERAALLRATRNKANERIKEAKTRIRAELAEARKQLERESESLGAEIARTILQRRPPSSPTARGPQ